MIESGQAPCVGAQDNGTMAIENTLGVAGGTRGVTKRRCRARIELGPIEFVGLVRDERLVADDVREVAGRHVRLIGHDDDTLDVLEGLRQRFDQRHDQRIDKQIAVFGVVDEVGDLLGIEARIDGMTDDAASR